MDEQQDGITAYHGTPHDFDEFDTSKIGTGEGAQSYGHGLYFAEHEPVAEGYRDRLAGHIPGDVLVGDEKHPYWAKKDISKAFAKLGYDPEISVTAAHYINEHKGDLHKAASEIWENKHVPHKVFEALLNAEFATPAGHMYEVHINAHPHHMLDWDKPLSEQPSHITKSLFDARKEMPTLWEKTQHHINSDSTAGDFYQSVAAGHPHGYAGATEQLSRAGIKGIKYLDAGSRGNKAEPTHNYVVFDHNDVHIKRKYEQGGAVDGYEDGGEVDDIPDIKNPISVFPKPQRMFPEENRPAGGQYLNAKTKEDMTGHKAAQASIGVQPGGKPFFNASADAVEQTGSHGKGNATAKTNLFKQKAGWKWVDAPEGHENTGTIVSVEHRGHHHYALNAHFPKGVDLARYENSPSEPRLRPTTKGNVTKGDQVGTILVRGKEHPVYNHVIVKANGGPIVNRALELLSKDRTGR
jgi:hypothetical protein